jgi:hypothetical protein
MIAFILCRCHHKNGGRGQMGLWETGGKATKLYLGNITLKRENICMS